MIGKGWLAGALALGSLGCAAAPAAAEARGTLPAKVEQAVALEAPGARITAHERDDLVIEAYEVEVEVAGRRLELTVASDGTLIEREEAVELGQVPAPAAQGIAGALRGTTAKDVEREERRAEVTLRPVDPPRVTFEVTFDRGQGEEEVEVDSAGAVLEDDARDARD